MNGRSDHTVISTHNNNNKGKRASKCTLDSLPNAYKLKGKKYLHFQLVNFIIFLVDVVVNHVC